jgi:hypothetical protein
MVLLAMVWAAGWFTLPDAFEDTRAPIVVMGLIAGVFTAWNLLACVVAAGFFHAASVLSAVKYRAYRGASLRLVIVGIVLLFPVPIAAQVLGNSPLGRALSLIITAMSIMAIVFGRARLRLIERRLESLAEGDKILLAPIEEIEQIGETGQR